MFVDIIRMVESAVVGLRKIKKKHERKEKNERGEGKTDGKNE